MRISEKLKVTSGLMFCTSLLLLTSGRVLAAETCATVPTCEELGYTKTECYNFISLKCPFDKTKLFCGSKNYESGDVLKKNGTAIGVVVNSNLAVAMKNEGWMEWDKAVAKCKAKMTGGESWRLPTLDELETIYRIKEQLDSSLTANGGSEFSTQSRYWSSTENTNLSDDPLDSFQYFWSISMYLGEKFSDGPYREDGVRCVFDF